MAWGLVLEAPQVKPHPGVEETPSSTPCQVLITCLSPGIILTEFTLLKIKPGKEDAFR